MKNLFLILPITLVALFSCSKEETPTVSDPLEAYINASENATWNYYSLSTNKLVGSAKEAPTENSEWFARTDWDIAINKYNIRTNSGAATSVAAQGGVYTCGPELSFSSIEEIPQGAAFASDMAITTSAMGGDVTTIRSEATVINFKTADDGSMIMPPVYLPAPIYIFRSADGNSHYKVQFTQYLDQNKTSGHVKFLVIQIK